MKIYFFVDTRSYEGDISHMTMRLSPTSESHRIVNTPVVQPAPDAARPAFNLRFLFRLSFTFPRWENSANGGCGALLTIAFRRRWQTHCHVWNITSIFSRNVKLRPICWKCHRHRYKNTKFATRVAIVSTNISHPWATVNLTSNVMVKVRLLNTFSQNESGRL